LVGSVRSAGAQDMNPEASVSQGAAPELAGEA